MTAVALAVAALVSVLVWPSRRRRAAAELPVPGRRPGLRRGPDRGPGPGQRPRWLRWWPSRSRWSTGGELPCRLGRRQAGRSAPDPEDVADALVLLALVLRTGLGLADALSEVQRCSRGAVHRDLAAVVAALRWARTVPDAWAFAAPVWRQVGQAWEVAVQTGSAPAEQVERVAQRLRESQEQDRERRAARAGVLLVLPLGLGFLPAFVCTAVVPVVLALASGVLGG